MSSPVPCDGELSIFHPIPYLLFPNDSNQPPNILTGNRDNYLRFWIHVALICLGFLLALVSFAAQCWKPLPYGKLSDGDGSCTIPLRISLIFAYLIPGFVIFTTTYFTGLHFSSPVNIVMYILFTLHYLARAILTPLVSKYSQNKITIWVIFFILLTNSIYHYTNAEFISSVNYCRGYYYDVRFIFGVILFLVGFVTNRVSDFQLLFLRKSRKDRNYLVPNGLLYYFISCPHYLGEVILWLGWALLTWSLSGAVWLLFMMGLVVTRSRHTHIWYRRNFKSYPSNRKALLPFVY